MGILDELQPRPKFSSSKSRYADIIFDGKSPEDIDRYNAQFEEKMQSKRPVTTDEVIKTIIGSSNCLGLFEGLEALVDKMTEGVASPHELRKVARSINQYFVSNGITVKRLEQSKVMEPHIFRVFGVRIEDTRERYRSLEPQNFPSLDYIFEDILVAHKRYDPEHLPDATFAVIRSPQVRKNPDSEAVAESYRAVLTELIESRWLQQKGDDAWKQPERVFNTILQATAGLPVSVPNILTRKFDGVSLEQVVKMPHVEQYAYAVMRLMQSLPQGDFFWQNVCTPIFFPQARQSPSMDDVHAFFTSPDMMKTITLVNWYMIERLFAPAIVGERPSKQFDNLMASMLDTVDETTFNCIGRSLSFGLALGDTRLKFMLPEMIDTLQNQPIFQACKRFDICELDIDMYLKSHCEEIQQNLYSLFKSLRRLDALVEGFEGMFLKSRMWNEMFSAFLSNNIQVTIGQEEYQRLFGESADMSWHSEHPIVEGREEHETETVALIHPQSVPGTFGFSSIRFHKQPYEKVGKVEGYDFVIRGHGDTIGLVGCIDKSGVITLLSLVEEGEHASLYPFVGYMVQQAYREVHAIVLPEASAVQSLSQERVEEPQRQKKLTIEEAHDLLESLLIQED